MRLSGKGHSWGRAQKNGENVQDQGRVDQFYSSYLIGYFLFPSFLFGFLPLQRLLLLFLLTQIILFRPARWPGLWFYGPFGPIARATPRGSRWKRRRTWRRAGSSIGGPRSSVVLVLLLAVSPAIPVPFPVTITIPFSVTIAIPVSVTITTIRVHAVASISVPVSSIPLTLSLFVLSPLAFSLLFFVLFLGNLAEFANLPCDQVLFALLDLGFEFLYKPRTQATNQYIKLIQIESQKMDERPTFMSKLFASSFLAARDFSFSCSRRSFSSAAQEPPPKKKRKSIKWKSARQHVIQLPRA